MAELLRITGDVLKEYILRAMEHVTSADKAYDWLKSQRAYAPRAEVRSTWAEVGRENFWIPVLKTWGTERTPHPTWVTEAKSELAQDYLYRFKVQVFDIETGQTRTEHWSYYHEKIESYADVWSAIEEEAVIYAESEGVIIIGWDVGGIVKSKEKPIT